MPNYNLDAYKMQLLTCLGFLKAVHTNTIQYIDAVDTMFASTQAKQEAYSFALNEMSDKVLRMKALLKDWLRLYPNCEDKNLLELTRKETRE